MKSRIFKQVYDFNTILHSVIVVIFALMVFLITAVYYFSVQMGMIILVGIVLVFLLAYLASVRNIIITKSDLILYRYPSPINLRVSEIVNVKKTEKRDFENLKKITGVYTLIGKHGLYKSKFYKELFVYSCSTKVEDNITIFYRTDIYIISCEKSDELLREIKLRLKND